MLCNSFKLSSKQRKMCRRVNGMAETIMESVKDSVRQCEQQFACERWNCSDGDYRLSLLRRGFKEAAFLHAISAASLTYHVSRACSSGDLDRCSCDKSSALETQRQQLKYGGCGDNIKYGVAFTKRFMKAGAAGRHADVQLHNNRLGIWAVRRNLTRRTCKCVGLSGSCTVKTCWLQLRELPVVARDLKAKTAHRKNAHTSKKTLLFAERSPDFCSQSKYSAGTTGRRCNGCGNGVDAGRLSEGATCDSMCCGRGYNTRREFLQRSCSCKVTGIVARCEICNYTQLAYYCK
ncbi:PREDICTED: protein Wnt-9a-like [Priapulus caudatus]|uniref:Protein Wnt n=2 Tax=Priapulus caudatus TaxID=37621 RepID=A0ABM1F998_PRICU|nr:PREDICTED: protein Wnt-9a-like [Priapulus caudatus]